MGRRSIGGIEMSPNVTIKRNIEEVREEYIKVFKLASELGFKSNKTKEEETIHNELLCYIQVFHWLFKVNTRKNLISSFILVK